MNYQLKEKNNLINIYNLQVRFIITIQFFTKKKKGKCLDK